MSPALTGSPNRAVSPYIGIKEAGYIEKGKQKVIVGSRRPNASVRTDGICPTITGASGAGGGHVPMHNYGTQIRKPTSSDYKSPQKIYEQSD